MKVRYLSHELEEKIVGGKLIRERIDYKFQKNQVFIIMERFYSEIESDLLGKDPLETEVVCEHFSFEGLEDGTWKAVSLDSSFYLQPILDVFIEGGVLHITLLQNQPEQELNVWIEPDSRGSIHKDKYKKATFEWANKKDLLEEAKENKKRELSSSCQEDILSGFDFEIGENAYHLSYDREAQVNLQERWQIFQNNMVEEMNITAHLGEEDVRLTVNKEIFSTIYMQSVMAKESKIKKLREDLFPLVERAKSQSELDIIKWDMEVIEPKPESIVLKDDKTLDKELDRVESDSAVANNEIISLIMLTNMMGGMG